jgi:lysophosphatidic acid acyltransferase / lysophosphatidylinositol acyltransferase
MITYSDFKKSFIPQVLISYAFLVSGLVVNILELIVYILVWPISRIWFRRITYYLSYLLWANVTSLGQWWSLSDVEIFMKEEDFKMLGKENIIAVYNHKYDVDWLFGWLMV